MRLVRKIDEQGFFIEDVILDDNDKSEDNHIQLEVPQGLHKPKWDGSKWEEGLTAEELAEATKPIPQEPTQIDYLVDLDFRMSMIELGM
jgi:hypothetical protein